MDYLATALCIAIGTGVRPWLIAVYSDTGACQLIGNTIFGMLGTIACAILFNWLSPTYGLIAVVSAGPVIALLAIVAG